MVVFRKIYVDQILKVYIVEFGVGMDCIEIWLGFSGFMVGNGLMADIKLFG